VRENREYYALRGTGEKIQRVWWFQRKVWERDKEYYGLRGLILCFKLRGERIQSILWFERKRRERTESIINWEEYVRT
jgi:hypothetical protein